MSEFKSICEKLWTELDRELGSVLHMWTYGNGGHDILEELKKDQCKQSGGNETDQVFLKNWKEELEKLKEKNKQLANLDQLQNELSAAQQSGASSIAIWLCSNLFFSLKTV